MCGKESGKLQTTYIAMDDDTASGRRLSNDEDSSVQIGKHLDTSSHGDSERKRQRGTGGDTEPSRIATKLECISQGAEAVCLSDNVMPV